MLYTKNYVIASDTPDLILSTKLTQDSFEWRAIIKQGDSASEVKICSGTKFKLPIDLIVSLKFITVLGFT